LSVAFEIDRMGESCNPSGAMAFEHSEAPVPQANGSVPIFLRVRLYITAVGD
jgi:hypothetical protein